MSQRPAWSHAARAIDAACGDDAVLARALQGVGLVRHFSMDRQHVPGWAPAYERMIPWRRRMLGSVTVQARGWQQRAWTAEAEAAMDESEAAEREALAARNRALRDAEVFVLAQGTPEDRNALRAEREAALAAFGAAIAHWFRTPAAERGARPALDLRSYTPPRPIYLERDSLAWRDHTGAAEGEGIAALAAFVWGCGRGRATTRIGRLVGVAVLTEAEVARQAAAWDAMHAA